jgi:hypothetical protein
VHVAALPGQETVRLVAVNDPAEPVEVRADAVAATLEGATRPITSVGARIGPDAAADLTEIRAEALEPGEILAFRWKAANGMAGGDIHAPVRWKHLALRDPKIRLATETSDGQLVTRLAAEAVALFATLEADRPGRFSTNAGHLFPGHDAQIRFTPAAGDPADATLTVRDLHSSFA